MATENAPAPVRDFVISRTFDAPRDLVWKAYSEAERLAQWWGPTGFTMEHVSLDFRPGGTFHYGMRSPDGGFVMWGRFLYREIEPQERMVFTSSFSDEQGGVTRAPFSADWPLEVLNVATFTEQDGRTTVHLAGHPVDPTEAEARTFEGMFDSMKQGFGGTFDQLEAYLARAA